MEFFCSPGEVEKLNGWQSSYESEVCKVSADLKRSVNAEEIQGNYEMKR